jgi:ribonuclease-3
MTLEENISYNFADKNLLAQALTHPSLSRSGKNPKNYERLEFLGDSVLSLIISSIIYYKYPGEAEGELARRKALLVSREVIARAAIRMGIATYLKISDGEENIGGRMNPANLENVTEALIGAVFLDGGLEPAKKVVEKFWGAEFDNMPNPPLNPKTELQEYMQKLGKGLPEYAIISSTGPSHKPEFTIEVSAEGFPPATGIATSRKAAENIAAENMLVRLRGK